MENSLIDKKGLKSPIKIITKEVEGEFTLKYAEPLKFNHLIFAFNILLSIVTVGLWGLVLYWSIQLRKKMFYSK